MCCLCYLIFGYVSTGMEKIQDAYKHESTNMLNPIRNRVVKQLIIH